jgi:hypothetical protein
LAFDSASRQGGVWGEAPKVLEEVWSKQTNKQTNKTNRDSGYLIYVCIFKSAFSPLRAAGVKTEEEEKSNLR